MAQLHWQSWARLRRAALVSADRGTLLIDKSGVEFRTGRALSRHWDFEEIHTVFIAPHRLVLKTYVNRSFHRPGQRRYRFELSEAMPPSVAASIADAVARPSQNADPDPKTPALAILPARHRGFSSGTNGVLRFRQGGIDYVTTSAGDSRSWRWSDLQTLSDPDPYHLFLFGYEDTYTFDLKTRATRKLLDWASDEIFQHSEVTEGAATKASVDGASTTGARHE